MTHPTLTYNHLSYAAACVMALCARAGFRGGVNGLLPRTYVFMRLL